MRYLSSVPCPAASARRGNAPRRPAWGAALMLLLGGALGAVAQPYTLTPLAGVAGDDDVFWADGPAGEARFYYPHGVALDPAGNVWVADTWNNVVRQITRTGDGWVVSTPVGSLAGEAGSADGTDNEASFFRPMGITVDAAGVVYVTDAGNNTVRQIVSSGTNWVVTTLAGSDQGSGAQNGPGSEARFNLPRGIAVDAATNLYVADAANQTVRKLTPAGSQWMVSTIAGQPGISGTNDGAGQTARFYFPLGIAVDGASRVLVADAYNNTLRQLAPTGSNWVVSTIAGMAGVPGSRDGTNRDARFYYPSGLALDGTGALYVADTQNHTFRKLVLEGTNWVTTTIAGLAGASGAARGVGPAARFLFPVGLAATSEGDIFVADTKNNLIRRGQPTPALGLTRPPGGLVLSWPLWAQHFQLEMTADLAAPLWTPLTNGVTVSGEFFVWTGGALAAPGFYRLHGP